LAGVPVAGWPAAPDIVAGLLSFGVAAEVVDLNDLGLSSVPSRVEQAAATSSNGQTPQPRTLVVAVDVLHRLPPDQLPGVLAWLHERADDVVFRVPSLGQIVAAASDPESPGLLDTADPPAAWSTRFAAAGFARDLHFRGESFHLPGGMRFWRGSPEATSLVAGYEAAYWSQAAEIEARRALGVEQRDELARRVVQADALRAEIARLQPFERRNQLLEREALDARLQADEYRQRAEAWEGRWRALEGSVGYAIVERLQWLRGTVLPPGSDRERLIAESVAALRDRDPSRAIAALRQLPERSRSRAAPRLETAVRVGRVEPRPPIEPQGDPVDIVMCVHNAQEWLERALAALERNTPPGYHLILIDDGSGEPTRQYLERYVASLGAVLQG
jgi:hypothetical protein